jgi:hypothetical protein
MPERLLCRRSSVEAAVRLTAGLVLASSALVACSGGEPAASPGKQAAVTPDVATSNGPVDPGASPEAVAVPDGVVTEGPVDLGSTPEADAPEGSTSKAPAGVGDNRAESLDVCSLLEPATLADTLDVEDVAVSRMPSSGWVAGQCGLSAASSGLMATISVGTKASLETSEDPGGSDAKSRLQAYAEQAPGGLEPSAVPGVGDRAVQNPYGMAAYSGGVYVELVNLGLDDSQVVEVVKHALSNL